MLNASRSSVQSVRRAWSVLLDEYGAVLTGFLVSRAVLLVVGLLTQIYLRPVATQGNPLRLSPHQALNIWGAWDTGWYMDLAVHGYQRTVGADGQANWAFFPAFPGLAALLSRLTALPPFEAMLVISNLSFLAALFLFHRFARKEFDRRTADIAVALLCVAPGSYIFSAAYTESLFLLCTTGCLLAIGGRRWVLAGGIAAAAVLTRNLGLGLLLPYAWTAGERLLASSERPRPSELVRMVVGGLLPLAALAGFTLYLNARAGDPLAFVHVQTAWRRDLSTPFSALLQSLLHPGGIGDGDLLSFAAAWLAIGLLVVLAAFRRWSLLLFALFLTLVPLATGLTSFARYMLVISPLWIVLAKLLSDRPRTTVATLSGLAILNGFMMAAWTLALRVAA